MTRWGWYDRLRADMGICRQDIKEALEAQGIEATRKNVDLIVIDLKHAVRQVTYGLVAEGYFLAALDEEEV